MSTAQNPDPATTPGTYTQTATLAKTGQAAIFTYQFANFFPLTVLSDSTVSNNGVGTVTVSTEVAPNVFTCSIGAQGATSGTCQASLPEGAHVTLMAAPADSTIRFGGWGGACAPFGSELLCALVMDSTRTITASFFIPTF